MKLRKYWLLMILSLLVLPQCVLQTKYSGPAESASAVLEQEPSGVAGFGILERLPGLWRGPVTSDTPAGHFSIWYVDFRPVSPGQVSQYTNMDVDTVNYLSFFIVKHDNQLKVALRTEGVFKGKGCVTYEVIDRVNEEKGYYRFADFQAGDKRACTEFVFNEDSFVMEVYTNKFNHLEQMELHSRWKAKLGDRSSAKDAIDHFNFPQPVMIKDFSNVFEGMEESIYFTFENDPYPSDTQPYLGDAEITVTVDPKLRIEGNHEFLVVLTTENLFDGLTYMSENKKYISRYFYLPAIEGTYTIKNIHPGKYHIYSYNDVNQDKYYKKGDYSSSDIKNTFVVPENGTGKVDTHIDYVIPGIGTFLKLIFG